MPPAEPELRPAPPPGTNDAAPHQPSWSTAALGAVLVLAVYIAGSPSLDAPWLMGDEHIFIVDNPEVTGAGVEPDTAWRRLKLIFRFPPEEDLYQPLPILTYALEWALTGGSVEAVRRDDLLLHALNALLFWWVLRRLLPRADEKRPQVMALSWSLALIGALHPVLVSAYAADMGRTHLLSATFALLSLGLHLRALEAGRWYPFGGAVGALLAAMLCKPVVGWVLLVLVLEAARLGWRQTLRSPRVYVVGVLCVVFAGLTYWTSRRSGLVQDAAAGLFGDPVSRSLLAVWIYFRNIVAPLWLSPWYLPDPRTGWTNPLVWLGVVLASASVVHAVRAGRRPEHRTVALGWAWCWVTLLPVIGLVGAREAAAVDRYLYLPLMGMALVVGMVVQPLIARVRGGPPSATPRVILATGALLGAVLLLWDLPHVRMYRSTLRRAQRTAEMNPGDPRALEGLAAAYDFATNHRLPADDLSQVSGGEDQQYVHFLKRFIATLRQAAAAPNLERYFPGPGVRAPFHRRLAHMFKQARQYQDSLDQAQKARALEPDKFLTWVRLAHAYHGLGQWDEAIAAYNRCEALLPPDPLTRATHFTDFGYLLLFHLERADPAYPKFQAAVATGRAATLAYVGLARCEIRVGKGDRGYDIIRQVLAAEPNNVLARLTLAEYHLRSHHWEDTTRAYGELVAAYPRYYQQYDWYYEALRGFHSVCDQLGQWKEAALAWDQAARLHPDSREFRSFRVWAVACAGQEDTTAWADDLLAKDPDNPLACLSQMLCALRAGQVEEAVEWVRRARRGTAIPRAREFERAAVVLKLLSDRGELPPEAGILRAVILETGNQREAARAALQDYVTKYPDSRWSELADRLKRAISDDAPP